MMMDEFHVTFLLNKSIRCNPQTIYLKHILMPYAMISKIIRVRLYNDLQFKQVVL